mgnify:CR=1 FL=1|jgi:hypothetical protein
MSAEGYRETAVAHRSRSAIGHNRAATGRDRNPTDGWGTTELAVSCVVRHVRSSSAA